MMNNHYRNHHNQPKARAIAVTQAAAKNTLRNLALFGTLIISTLLALLLINP